MIKLLVTAVLLLISLNAYAKGSASPTVHELLEIHKADSNLGLIIYVNAASGVSFGHMFGEMQRVNQDQNKAYMFHCWDEATKLTKGQHYRNFIKFVTDKNAPAGVREWPIGLGVAIYLTVTYPPCK